MFMEKDAKSYIAGLSGPVGGAIIHANVPEGPAYSIRTICDKRFKYIMNLHADLLYFEKHMMSMDNNDFRASWEAVAKTDPETAGLMKLFMDRPPEEFYDLKNDPWELKNLAASPKHRKIKDALKSELIKFLEARGDRGAEYDRTRRRTGLRSWTRPK
jgi:uncharacterized sulfatase